MHEVSIRQYAKHRGISHTAVQKAIKQGRIQSTPEGKIDVDLADREWDRNTTPASKPMPAAAPRQAESATSTTYAHSRAVRESYLARLAKIEFEERSGKLISRDEVTVAAFTNSRTIRDNLLNIPDRIAALLAAENDPVQTHRILSDEIRRALSELSSEVSG